jgi:hypothetical protein
VSNIEARIARVAQHRLEFLLIVLAAGQRDDLTGYLVKELITQVLDVILANGPPPRDSVMMVIPSRSCP